MPSTREVRRRIRAVKNMAQITRAMQMVASSKMRRAQERVQQSRPYSEQLRALVSRLANASGEDVGQGVALLKQRPVRNIGYLLISPDRGLSGALPSNINRRALLSVQEEQNRLTEQGGQRPGLQFIAVGRKGRDFVVRSRLQMIAEFTNYGDRPTLSDAAAIAQVAVDAFLKGEVDVVYLVYAKFVNTVTQQPIVVQLLPVQPPSGQEEEQRTVEYIYEPDPRSIYEALLPRYVDVLVYQALLENIASFYSAQMVAMKNATDNANELVQDLTLAYNKARQASITTQILEVVSGANAL
ncbi:MAG TPA: ATP synthase F1 subunit gamma [Ktedonobacteraceae bacterium]|jgi:F-type H+-transporting ATPase subunit gamma|nr:ATP synthase F1 subunit gamma [Ktedonobacteraceae bacterium]